MELYRIELNALGHERPKVGLHCIYKRDYKHVTARFE